MGADGCLPARRGGRGRRHAAVCTAGAGGRELPACCCGPGVCREAGCGRGCAAVFLAGAKAVGRGAFGVPKCVLPLPHQVHHAAAPPSPRTRCGSRAPPRPLRPPLPRSWQDSCAKARILSPRAFSRCPCELENSTAGRAARHRCLRRETQWCQQRPHGFSQASRPRPRAWRPSLCPTWDAETPGTPFRLWGIRTSRGYTPAHLIARTLLEVQETHSACNCVGHARACRKSQPCGSFPEG